MPNTLEEFAAGCPIYIASYKYQAPYAVVEMRANLSLWKGGYDLAAQNCEHFATWCKTGCGVSLQSNRASDRINFIVKQLEKTAEKLPYRTLQNLVKKTISVFGSFAENISKSVNFSA